MNTSRRMRLIIQRFTQNAIPFFLFTCNKHFGEIPGTNVKMFIRAQLKSSSVYQNQHSERQSFRGRSRPIRKSANSNNNNTTKQNSTFLVQLKFLNSCVMGFHTCSQNKTYIFYVRYSVYKRSLNKYSNSPYKDNDQTLQLRITRTYKQSLFYLLKIHTSKNTINQTCTC